ncbi:hypothetical protein BGZ49_009544, partial [Haplosporangium sp. Z 27]
MSNILPVFEQLGLFEDLKKVSLPHIEVDFYDGKRNKTGNVDLNAHKLVCGYDCYVLPRPKLYELIRNRVPAHKVTMGKEVLRTKEENNKVTVYCVDGTTYECDILVGADGAYSAVRHNIYKKLGAEGKLPSIDEEDFSIGYVNMAGVASPANPGNYSELSDDRAHFRVLLGERGESSYSVTAPNNQICWGTEIQLPASKSKDKEQHYRNSEWGGESVETMLKIFEDFPCPNGGTMKDMFDATPNDLISKAFLKEKIFQTWYHGRTVLLGDACHKVLPSFGQGAVLAMKDAVVLANCIFNMVDTSSASVRWAFDSYYNQRFPDADIVFQNSAQMSKVISTQKWTERAARYIMSNYMPHWLLNKKHEKDMAFRPQINWLPLIESKGTGEVLPQVGRGEASKDARSTKLQ